MSKWDTDRHASRASLHPAARAPGLAYEADEIELACAYCTLELGEHGWTHDRACVLAGAPVRLVSSAQQAPAQ